jgi:hypothetical protein
MTLLTEHTEQEPSYTDVESVVEANRLHRARARRRRTVVVAIVALFGLILAAVWAVGIAETGESTGTATAASIGVGVEPTSDESDLVARIANGPDASLPINFVGRWGDIPADTSGAVNYQLFNVDLGDVGGVTPAGTDTFFVEIGLTNPTTEFRALQFEWVAANEACTTADFDPAPSTVDVLYGDTSDAVVVFSDLTNATADDWCFGVLSTGGKANDATGTFIRRNSTGTTMPTDMPQFFAVLGRHS